MVNPQHIQYNPMWWYDDDWNEGSHESLTRQSWRQQNVKQECLYMQLYRVIVHIDRQSDVLSMIPDNPNTLNYHSVWVQGPPWKHYMDLLHLILPRHGLDLWYFNAYSIGISTTVTISVGTAAVSRTCPETHHLSNAIAVIKVTIFTLLYFPDSIRSYQFDSPFRG